MSWASIGRPNSVALPSLAGSSPVSIFMVVVLPQPLEPTKPKISPRSMSKLDMVDRGEVAEAAGQTARHDHRLVVELAARRNDQLAMARLATLVGQQAR